MKERLNLRKIASLRRDHFSDRLLELALVGCYSSSTSHASKESATDALVAVQKALDNNRYIEAHDLLLAAIRIDPSSPKVFEATLEFVQQAVKSDDDKALDLAHDLYVRVAGLIPFQPLQNISSVRDQYQKTGGLFEATVPYEQPNPLESIHSRIRQLSACEMPSKVAPLVAQAIRNELELAAITVVDDPSVLTDDFWREWHELDSELEQIETAVWEKLYAEVRAQTVQWQNGTKQLLQRCENTNNITELASIGQEIDAIIQEGYRLRSQLVPFVEVRVSTAKNDEMQIGERLDRLEREKEWIYNQHMIAAIKYVQESKDSPLDKLKKLAQYDEHRLSPYVYQRYQESWNQWVEELDEKQKIEAVKIRILGKHFP